MTSKAILFEASARRRGEGPRHEDAALQNAASVASLMLTTEALVTEPRRGDRTDGRAGGAAM